MSSLCEVQNQPEMQYSLLSVLGNRDQKDVSRTLLRMSTSPDTCAAMRSSGCLPLIIRLLYAPDSSQDMKRHVALALHNIVNSNQDEVQSKLEGRVLSLLENVRDYCDSLLHHCNDTQTESQDKNIGMTVATILRLSFDGDQRRAMSMLGGLHSIANLIQILYEVHGGVEDSIHCLMLKRYASMALTNLTSGHNSNKTLLCSLKHFMHALVAQLTSTSEELQQATASVIRNLSWKADPASKQILRETGAVSVLMKMAMRVQRESTLQSMLSALWNLSSNCSLNKIELCAVDGALGFLIRTLTYKSASQKLSVVEYAGGILRNISSYVAEREDYRAILREYDCFQVLIQQLTNCSTRVVGNACITLWNLSSDCSEDQYTLWALGAPNVLKNLVYSKHKLIALGSSAALKNLLASKPDSDHLYSLFVGLPAGNSNGDMNHGLGRSKSVEEELDEVLSESRFKTESQVSPSTVTGRRDDKFVFSVTDVEKKRQRRSHRSHSLSRSGSKEHVSPSLLDNGHDSAARNNPNNERKHSSNIDISIDNDSSKQKEDKSNIGKYASLVMSDDTEGDLNFDNEAISTVDELLEVVKDMASLRLNEDSSTKRGELERKSCNQSQECHIDKRTGAESKTKNNFVKESRPEWIDFSELKSKNSSLEKELQKPTSKDFVCSEVDPFTQQEFVPVSKEEETATYEESTVKQEPVTSSNETVSKEDDDLSPEKLQRSKDESEERTTIKDIAKNTNEMQSPVLNQEDLQPEELVTDESISTPKNVSLMSPRSPEELPLDDVDERSTVMKEPVSSKELYRSYEDLPSEKPKKNSVRSPEELGQCLEKLTLDDVKNESEQKSIDFPNDVEEAAADDTHYLDFSLGESDENKRVQADRESSPEVYGDYAETDLDQPTDYSLQYGEEDELSDVDEVHPNGKRDAGPFYVSGVPISIHEDTVKTYCTEGTPFETPYNFSTATSMSDLRAEPSIKEEIDELESGTASGGQKDAAASLLASSVQVKAELVDDALLLDRIHSMDSGLLSPPEKPVQFCEEGTPGQCISRFSSLSSLCGDVNQADRVQHKGSTTRGTCSPYLNGGSDTFQDEPLHSKTVNANSTMKSDNFDSDNIQTGIVKASVFEDALVPFKDETTPINFSCATSLSSLSFDDEPKIPMDPSLKRGSAVQRASAECAQVVEEDTSDSALPNCSKYTSHQRRKDAFPAEDSTQGPCNLKPVPTGGRSPRVAIKQDNASILSTPGRANGEEADACEDSTYRFCTEGTPANISHAGSHSDLSILSIPHLRSGKLSDKNSVIDESSDDNLSFSDECENILAECIKSGMPRLAPGNSDSPRNNAQSSAENENSSGNVTTALVTKEDEKANAEEADAEKQREDIGEDRGKVVTFNSADHYAEETPLMFSRASSLASLSSFDQQSIVDDRSSIISDLSRLTSGAVSPSEIPDSPSQLVSASPHRSKAPSEFRADKPNFTVLPPANQQPFNKTEQSCVFEDDVKPFKVEDTPVEFSRATSLSSLSICDDTNPAEEGAVCLPKEERENLKDFSKEEDEKDKSDKNSIILESEGEEDDDAILAACISIGMQQSRKTPDLNPQMFNNYSRNHFSSALNQPNHPGSRLNHSGSNSNHSSDRDHGGNVSKHRESRSSHPGSPPILYGSQTDHPGTPPNLRGSQPNHPVLPPTKCEYSSFPKANQQIPNTVNLPSRSSEPAQDNGAFDDVTYRYFTEDTPANISHAASQSDLSVLSFRSGKDEAQGDAQSGAQAKAQSKAQAEAQAEAQANAQADDLGRTRTSTELSDDLFNVSDNEGMLAECIQAGMPKKSTPKKRNNSLNSYPEREINGNFSPRSYRRDDRNNFDSYNDRPRSSSSSQQLSPVLHKSKPSRPMSANSHVSSWTTKSSHSRKSRRAVSTSAEPRRVEGAGAFEDSMYRFNTEDTPASISHAGSNSDISILSIPDDDKEFFHDYHKRQHSFHYLSDDSLDNSDNENILAECIQSGMPKAKTASKPTNKPCHSGASSSHGLSHHQVDTNFNFSRRSNQVAGQQIRHASRSTARMNRNVGMVRRSLSQSDRPQNYPVNVNHGFMMPHQQFASDVVNRNVVATGMWSTGSMHKIPNREKEIINCRTQPSHSNNNPHSYDSGWEMDASILKDSQALRSMLQNHQNLRWLRKFRSTSPSNRRHSESQCSSNTFYSRENSSNMIHNNGDLGAASMKVPNVQPSHPSSLPPNIRPLDRQRTFTKLEPSQHIHLPSPSSKTKIPVPSQPPTKLPEKPMTNSKKSANVETVTKGRLKSKTSIVNTQTKKMEDKVSDRMKVSKSSNGYTSSSSRASCSWSGKSTPTSTLRSNGPTNSSSSSTSSLVFKQNATERRSFRVSRPTGLEDKRSNSFSSITSSASSKSSVRPFKKEVTSKVASLWKRTDTSSDDGQGKTNMKRSDNEKRAPATRKMVRSATFEGLPRNLELAKTDKVKIKDDSQVRPSNHVDRSKKMSHKSRSYSDKKEELTKVKSQAQYNKSAENVASSRDDACTSVINRHDRAMTLKSSAKTDQNSVRVTKV